LIDNIALVLLAMEGLLAGGPRHVLVFDHVFQLAFHRDDEEHDEVHDQNGPEYGHVKHLEQGARESDKGCTCSPPPKLKLGQPPDKGLKLGIARSRQGTSILLIFVIVRLGLDLWRQEGDKQVQEINMKRVRDNVKSLEHPHPEPVDQVARGAE